MSDEGRTPSPWELMRMLEKIDNRLEAMENRMVSNAVFQAHQEAVERRFLDVEKDQQAWIVESRGEHVRLDAEIRKHREAQDALERQQRESRTRTWLSIGVACLGALLSLGAALILRATGG